MLGKSTRVAYGEKLLKLGGERQDIVVFDADLATCTMTCYFAEEYPERFFNTGIQEANMVGMGAGMATTGKTVLVNSFAMFTAGRAYDQIRNSVCYPQLNVKVVGTHAGLSVGEDGATHQCIEDVALMRVVPGMTVVVPCDAEETMQALEAIVDFDGPCYFRLGRAAAEEVVTKVEGYRFEIGKAAKLREGTDVTLIANGLMVDKALKACELLDKQGISARVLNMHTVKPLDEEAVYEAAVTTGALVTGEEHNIIGGLGGAVAEFLEGSDCRVPLKRVGVEDKFGHSGPAAQCLEAYGLTAEALVDAALKAIAMK